MATAARSAQSEELIRKNEVPRRTISRRDCGRDLLGRMRPSKRWSTSMRCFAPA